MSIRDDTPTNRYGPAALRTDTVHDQNAGFRRQGSIVPVELPGGVRAWAVSRADAVRRVLDDPLFARNPRHWRALADGEVPDGWPLLTFVTNPSMTTSDGPDHRRLRKLVAQAFTPRAVERMQPSIETHVTELLDRMAAAGATGGAVDFREEFAYRLPLLVVGDMLGFPADLGPELHRITMEILSSESGPEEEGAAARDLYELLGGFVALRRLDLRPDVTTALMSAVTPDGERLSERELVGTLATLLVAGHGTVTNLLCNAVRVLLSDPEQLAELTGGRLPWDDAVEEVLRWDSPIAYFPMRYATQDVDFDGVPVRAGDALIVSYVGAGRDEAEFGPSADRFDIARTGPRHLSFGHGVHFCVGAPLARMQGRIALSRLFERFPGLRLGTSPDELRPLPSLIDNGVRELPLLLT